MKTLLLVTSIAAGLSLAASAEAREGNRGARMDMPTFEQLDTDGDGGITLQEIQAAMTANAQTRFTETDTNGDGGLSVEEMTAKASEDAAARATRRAERHLENADANGDGLLQADEIAAHRDEHSGRRGPNPQRMFERVDADNNGSVSLEEYEEARAHMAERGPRGDN